MRLMRVGVAGQERPAVLHEGVIRDLSGHVGDIDGVFLEGGGVERVARLLDRDADQLPVVPVDTRIGAPIARPHHLLCIGLNYADHARESNVALPDEPIVFSKAPNTLVGPNDDVLLPPGAEKVDWEVELGVVIGSRARYLKDEASARACIAGYVLCNDISERHFQLERGGQWVKGKSCETFNPFGPWLVTPDEVSDVSDLRMTLDLNGERQQDGSTATMIFSPAHIVWYVSQFMVLEPGDLINTGTPPGVGMGQNPPRYLRDGDVVELSIAGMGVQRQAVRPAP